VADLVRGAAEAMQMPSVDARLAYRAALVHDVGRFGVPGSVWGKPGPLTPNEQERVRLHVYYVERIFTRPEPLRRIGLLAATHHERMDGSGYHRGVGGAMLSSQARVLAVADAYTAMREPRPYRAALSKAETVRELKRDAAEGRFDPIATDAVLAAAGHRVDRARAGGPAGLTTRETEVLALLSRGMPNKGIARELGISPKTVSNHVERVYSKLGVSNRTGAAMYAMQYGMVGPDPALAG
jgi:HD-GYP domain-containing protein (c-di-GMP phosphodiesterase class II)